jgi:predicted ATPase/class 3 adenylate cyclase
MPDYVRDWLESLGLGKYSRAFCDNDIGRDVLVRLQKDDLEKMGVSLGDRLRFMNAIHIEGRLAELGIVPDGRLRLMRAISAEAGGDPGSSMSLFADRASMPTRFADTPTGATASNDAERRPLTVMFCDLADSTALSTRLDPEDLQDVIRSYQETCTGLIQEYEGFVAKYMGDGILIYFGYPKSLERNAERAVHSALNIVAAMGELNQTLGCDKGVEIAVRIGIATGIVMVGEIVGEGMAQERTVIGEAPNMAARLQGVAGRNGIVIGALTRELLGDAFLYEDLGSHELKGISGLIPAWGVTGLRDETVQEADRDDDRESAVVPVLVGRDEEVGLLRRAWQSTKKEGRGQVVTLTGEAGIGKSALIDGLKADVRVQGLPQLTMHCSPYHTNSALYPVIEHFKRLARWQPEDDVPARLAKLENMLGRHTQPLAESVPLMASLLSLVVPEDRYPVLALTPQQQKQQTQDMITGITMEVAESRPFLQIWEDLHWADPSTLELIGLLIEQTPTASLLMVLTARPEFVPPWPARSHITPITLNRLERPHAEALIARIGGAKPLPEEVVDHIATKTDGVPLYVEELTKTILASDILRDAGDFFELTGPLSSLSIPDTLQDSLMARLDRLPEVRELAQLGSVLGREFAYEMISGLATASDSELQSGLGQLVDAELLYQRGRPPRAKYIFKHALVQDAAYGSLIRRTRQKYHQQVAELLEAKFPNLVEDQPELIAHHYAEAGSSEKAVDFWQRAGRRANGRFAHGETISHFRNAVALLSTLEPTPKRTREVAGAQIAIAGALSWTAGPGATEVGEAYAAARDLCEAIGDDGLLSRALLGSMGHSKMKGEWRQAETFARQLLKIARVSGRPADLLPAHVSLGECFSWQGNLNDAKEQIDRSMALEQEIAASKEKIRTSPWARVATYTYLAWLAMTRGAEDEAMAALERSLRLAEDLAHPYSRTYALHFAAHVAIVLNRPEEALAYATRAIELATEQQFVAHISGGHLYRGVAREMMGEDALEEIRVGVAGWQSTFGETGLAFYQAQQAAVLSRHGQVDEAHALILGAKNRMESSDERIHEAEIRRIHGEIVLAQSGEAATAEACEHFTLALATARSQNSPLFELRACVSLAGLLRGQGEARKARDMLAPVFERLPEGFASADLQAAEALLNDLAER